MTDNEHVPSEGSETGFETGESDEFSRQQGPVVLDIRGTDVGRSSGRCTARFSASLQQVNLAGCNLAEIPHELFGCSRNLTVLNLSLNQIQQLPAKFGRFSKLRSLYADFNNLAKVPAEVGCLHDLEVLSVKGNNLQEIPQELCHLSNLEKISLAGNELRSLPQILLPYWTHLQHIDLRKNNLNGELNLNPITCLRYLEISENSVSRLCVDALQELEYVDCSHNKLSKLHLTCEKLLHLNASFNNLSSLSASSDVSSLLFVDASNHSVSSGAIIKQFVANLPVLLVLHNNQFTRCPQWICQNLHLAEIDLSHNRLEKLPEELLLLPRLDTVRVNHNRLKRVEVVSGRQFYIRHIDLQHNEIWPNLPDEFLLEAPRLEWLNASWNRLQSFPNITGFQLPLRWLLLSHNDLIDDVWGFVICCPKLRVLKLTFNNLQTIPDDLYSLTDLRDLYLTGNKLSSMPSNIPFVMAQLETLLLDCNQLLALPAFDKCRHLSRLDVSCNSLSAVNLHWLVPRSLEVLDISCNEDIAVDTTEFQQLCGDRNVSVVDTNFSGRLGPFSKEQINFSSQNHHWTVGFCESERSYSRLYINQCCRSAVQQQEVVLAICESYANPAVCSEAKTHLADLIRDMRKRHQQGEVGALARTDVALQKIVHEVYKKLQSQICPHQMSLLLCHIAPSDSNPTVIELTVLHTGTMSCIVASNRKSNNVLHDRDRAKKCLHSEWKAAVEVNCPQAGFAADEEQQQQQQQFTRSQLCDAIPQPQTLKLNLNVSNTSAVIFSCSMLTEALSPEEIIREFELSPNAVAGSKRLNDAVCSLISDRGTSTIAIDLSKGRQKEIATSTKLPPDERKIGRSVQIRNPKCHLGRSVHFKPDDEAQFATKSAAEMKDYNRSSMLNGGTTRRHWRRSRLLDEFPQNSEAYKAWDYVLEENHKKLFDRELESIGAVSTRTPLAKCTLRRPKSTTSGSDDSRF